jgi:Zn-dependent oligopeptidase
MHNLCSLANYTALSGTKVERDFVEMPSQMLENWIWEESIMKRLSKHVETGEALPTEIITNKINSQKVCQAYELMRQLQIGTYDLLINSV